MTSLYPVNIESKLGFDSVRVYLKDRCQSALGLREVEKMEFSSDKTYILNELHRTDEMKQLLERGGDVPEASFNDLESWLQGLKVPGSYGSTEEFGHLKKTLVSFENVRTFFLRKEGNSDNGKFIYPNLAAMFSQLETFPHILKSIDSIIDKTGSIRDTASPDLYEVRQKLSSLQGSVARVMQRIFSSAVKEGITDKDSSPTIRDGRLVIPVPAGNKRSLQGIIHDESATGKTVFIEPAETVELSNRIRELEIEEQRIIVKILIALTDEVRPSIESILSNNLILGKLDFLMAKAKFAIEIGGQLPSVSSKPELDWYGAVHPVLLLNLKKQGRSVVPLNIRLEGQKRILLISGPNAGGKSVALKTVGIVQYMFQCGLLPTLYSNSHVGIFNKIFIDIGDEQSIENDLSTYSSHLKNMRHFLLHANSKTLILIDEIGSGTEPNIGSSIAKAILNELANSHCFGVVTTHYHNLKRFAEEHDYFINGAMLYDRQKLQPTFLLSIGNAGSSFAIEIAGKIGLPKKIIEMAKQEVGEEYVESDKFLMEIARDRKYWQSKRANIKERETKLEQLEQRYEKLISELNQKRKDIIKEAQEEARQLLSGTNRKIENTIMEIRKADAEKERTKQIRKDLEAFKLEVENAQNTKPELKSANILPKRKKQKKEKASNTVNTVKAQDLTKKELSVKDYVKMAGSNSIGQILSISGKEAEVAFGNLRTVVKISKLTATQKPGNSNSLSSYTLLNGNSSDVSRQRQLNFKDELDIRGMRADEALDNVTHFVDDALQFGIKKIRILHGTGAGILRQLVRQQLSATPGIAKFEDEDVRMGGAGITVVTMI